MAAETGLLQRFRQARLSGWLLAAFCGWALLLWLGALLGMGGRIAAPEVLPAGELPRARPAAPDRIGPLTQYASAAARPLFTEDRRPRTFLATAPEGEGQDPASDKLDFLLTGVLISPQVRLAILQPTGGGESQRVRVGNAPEGAAGWRLIDVQPRRALFEGAGGQATLDLRTYGDAGSPPAPVAVSAVPPSAPPPPASDGSSAAENAAAEAAAAAAPPEQQARIDEIRRRIEARRAQLRANQQQTTADKPASGPGAR